MPSPCVAARFSWPVHATSPLRPLLANWAVRPRRSATPSTPSTTAGWLRSWSVPSQPHHHDHLRCGGTGAPPGPRPSQPPRLRPSHQRLDPRPPGRGERDAGIDQPPGQRRDHPHDRQTVGEFLEASQALDYQPRPGVRTKKRRRDRLIVLAAQHPEWALGFGDETWWTRVSQPALHTWGEEPLRLLAQSVAKDDPDPKALACYGLLVRYADAQPETLWLRFVDGRPVS